ncbi:hypothetical protein DFH08DRAFT_769322 [Mycena albidolilacea]|uniref:F-box domain-containing protein n=1 Tax=Mycena albidolilacea TaxID=1033008 RepID=A0AAD7AHW8_9AGAR|nr:hypothetical protein DFH08DRAFT_769322 [Mycena albidolilacea]
MTFVCERCGHRDYRSSFSFSQQGVFTASGGSDSSSPEQLRANLDQVKTTILRQKAYLDELEETRRRLESELAQIVYPALTLPPEIVSRIFVECLPGHGRVRPSPDAPPLSLAQICRHWREIAISSCELWASVDMDGFFSDGTGHEKELLQMWFARAKGRPLSVTIRSPNHGVPPSIMSLVSSVCERLHSLELDLSHEDFLLLEQHSVTFPRLRRLVIFHRHGPSDYDPLHIFQNAPALSELGLEAHSGLISDLYPMLTSIDLGSTTFNTVLDVLHQYPRLLQLTAHITDGLLPRNVAVSTAHHLESLILHNSSLRSFTLPDLCRLELHNDGFLTLLPFLVRSSCTLEHLRLPLYGDETELVDGFQAVPSLKSLSIDVPYGVDLALFVQVLDTDPLLLPQLRTLAIFAPYKQFNYLAFIQLLQAQCDHPGHPARLVSVQLNLYGDDDEGHYKDDWLSSSVIFEFNKLVEQGMTLQATYNDDEEVWPDGSMDPCETFPSSRKLLEIESFDISLFI